MRKAPAAVVISAVLHLGAIAWVHAHGQLVPTVHPSVATLPPAPPSEPEPVVVTLLDDHTVSQVPDLGEVGAHATASHGTQAISRGGAHSGATGSETTGSKHSDLMTMRHPEVTGGLSDEFMRNFIANTKPLAPKDVGGDQLAFEVGNDIANLNNPRYVANASPDELREQREALEAHREEQGHVELRPSGGGSYRADHTETDQRGMAREAFTANIEPDGTAHFRDAPNLQVGGLGGSFDTTDWMMRRHGEDPYASAKLKFLDQTRDERARIGTHYHHELLSHSAQLMQQNLARLWAKTSDLAARKQGVFELWDECAEIGDADLVAGGGTARSYALGFIRSRFVGADAFTADEIAHFNARRQSKAAFAPYDGSS